MRTAAIRIDGVWMETAVRCGDERMMAWRDMPGRSFWVKRPLTRRSLLRDRTCGMYPELRTLGASTQRRKSEYTPGMDVREHLRPKQVVDLLAQRVRKRINVLEGVRLTEYTIALYELRLVLDLLQRGAKYIEDHEGKPSRRGF